MTDFDEAARLLGVPRETLPTSWNVEPISTSARTPVVVFERLSDLEWEILSPLIPKLPVPKATDFNDRLHVDAALWFTAARASGHGWAALPEVFAPRATRQHRHLRWCVAGTWEAISTALDGDERLSLGRREAFGALAVDARRRRERILERRRRLNESS